MECLRALVVELLPHACSQLAAPRLQGASPPSRWKALAGGEARLIHAPDDSGSKGRLTDYYNTLRLLRQTWRCDRHRPGRANPPSCSFPDACEAAHEQPSCIAGIGKVRYNQRIPALSRSKAKGEHMCGTCVDNCPSPVIRYAFSAGRCRGAGFCKCAGISSRRKTSASVSRRRMTEARSPVTNTVAGRGMALKLLMETSW